MDLVRDVREMHEELSAWRRDLHAHPETAFQEHRTSNFIAEKLTGFGLDVHRGLAGTGVVGTLKSSTGERAIGLRADMDALYSAGGEQLRASLAERRQDARVRP